MNTLPAAPSDLPGLAEAINIEHRHFEESLQAGLLHARNAGELLLRAKERLPHGGWLPWLRDNCRVNDRTARKYMQIAARWPELVKSALEADLTISQALKLLAHTPESGEPPEATEAPMRLPPNGIDPGPGPAGLPWFATMHHVPVESRRGTMARWWDILAGRTLFLDAIGWPAERIAGQFGVRVEEVTAILDPRPPERFLTPEDGADFPGGADREYRERFRSAYRQVVEATTSRLLGTVLKQAAGLARECEREDVEAELRAIGKAHDRRYRRLDESLHPLDLGPGDVASVYMVSLTDARDGLLIEPRPGDGFIALWEEYRDELAEAARSPPYRDHFLGFGIRLMKELARG